MIKLKNNFIFLSYFLIFFFLVFEMIFSKKNISLFLSNNKTLSQKSVDLKNKEEKKESLELFLNNFKNSSEFRKLIIKEKLFYKDEKEKVFLYKINP
ncbi:MAG: hypothetical protein CMM90_04530 [Rickettsiales bacterium]|nr:hypothetical protein [Rickettsiales bacterium]